MHILDHSQGAFMFEEKILCLYSLYRMNRKRYLYVVTSIFPPDAIRISRWGVGSIRWNIISRSLNWADRKVSPSSLGWAMLCMFPWSKKYQWTSISLVWPSAANEWKCILITPNGRGVKTVQLHRGEGYLGEACLLKLIWIPSTWMSKCINVMRSLSWIITR